MKILIIDHETINANFYKLALERSGLFSAVIAENGESALEILKNGDNGNIGLIFIVIMLRGKGGFQLTSELRETVLKDKPISIIALSSVHHVGVNPEVFIASGFNDYLLLPISAENLVTKAKKWFRVNR